MMQQQQHLRPSARAAQRPFRPAVAAAPRRSVRAAAAGRIPEEADVVVVGAGVAGLSAAATLQRAGVKPLVLEASDGVGANTATLAAHCGAADNLTGL